MNMGLCLVIIKPDVVQVGNVGKIITILEELGKGTPIKKIAEMTGMIYQNVYGAILQLKKKGYKIQKVGKGTFQIVK